MRKRELQDWLRERGLVVEGCELVPELEEAARHMRAYLRTADRLPRPVFRSAQGTQAGRGIHGEQWREWSSPPQRVARTADRQGPGTQEEYSNGR